MLSKIIKPKTKAELIQSLQKANIQSFDIYEGDETSNIPSIAELKRQKASIIVLKLRS
jgi:hypothetical protein